jgi:hypothetical protein
VASRLSRLQEQAFFNSHKEFLLNRKPVHEYHISCIEHFFLAGKAKVEAAGPATLALLLQSPSRTANIMKPFRCWPDTVSIFLHH